MTIALQRKRPCLQLVARRSLLVPSGRLPEDRLTPARRTEQECASRAAVDVGDEARGSELPPKSLAGPQLRGVDHVGGGVS